MADFTYTYGSKDAAEVNMATADLRVLLVTAGSNALTNRDAQFLGSFSPLNEFAGSPYARQALSGEALAVDLPNDRTRLNASAITFPAINGGSPIVAAIVYRHVTNDSDSIPWFKFELSHTPSGSDLVIDVTANGVAIIGGD